MSFAEEMKMKLKIIGRRSIDEVSRRNFAGEEKS